MLAKTSEPTRSAPRVPAGRRSLAGLASEHLHVRGVDAINARAGIASLPSTSQVQSLAIHYAEASRLEEDMAATAIKFPQLKGACVAMPLDQVATAVMQAPPASIGDIAVTIGLAASWAGFVADGLRDGSPHQIVAVGIGRALANATLLLSRIEDLPVEGAALDLLNSVLAEALRGGAGLAPEVTI